MSFRALNRRSRLVALAFWIVLSGTLLRARPADDFQTAERLFRQGEFTQAEALFSKIPPGEPSYPRALLRLGTIYYATGRPALAERALTECLRRKESAEAYCLLAGAQFNYDRYIFVTVDLLRSRGKLEEGDYACRAISRGGSRRTGEPVRAGH